MESKFSLYFSHSWDPVHVSLNIYIWKQVCSRCNLIIDQPADNVSKPPYYVNRLEEMMRRSDLFIAVLPLREPGLPIPGNNRRSGDERLKCSAGSLFEIRLAERANKPRLIIYDIRSGFVPPTAVGKYTLYKSYNLEEILDRLEDKDGTDRFEELDSIISTWLSQIDQDLSPIGIQFEDSSFVLLPNSLKDKANVMNTISEALEEAGYQKPLDLTTDLYNDAYLTRVLRPGGLLVADISCLEEFYIYCFAHAMFVPTIRLLYQGHRDAGNQQYSFDGLPKVLQGHPGGYQHDIVRWADINSLKEAIANRASAMFQKVRTITKYNEGESLFKGRLYGKHSVFISHNQKGNDRKLIEAIKAGLDAKKIVCWEYAIENEAGVDWQAALNEKLETATHFVLLLSNDYELSPACVHELEYALYNNVDVSIGKKIIPFLIKGRERPNVKITDLHHKILNEDIETNASIVVQTVEKKLLS